MHLGACSLNGRLAAYLTTDRDKRSRLLPGSLDG